MSRSLESVETAPLPSRKFLSSSPMLFFLDVQMPGMDGFEVLRALPSEDLAVRNPFLPHTSSTPCALSKFMHWILSSSSPWTMSASTTLYKEPRQVKILAPVIQMAERILSLLEENSGKDYVSRFSCAGRLPDSDCC